MIKKYASILSAATLAVVAGMMVFGCSSEEKTTEEVSLEAVPASSMMIARIENPEEMLAALKTSRPAGAFDSLAIVESLGKGYRLLKRLCGAQTGEKPITVAASKVGAKGISLMFVAKTPEDFRTPAFGNDTLVSTDRYEKTDITTVKTPSGTYSYYLEGGNVVMADSRLYIEQSILQLDGGGTLAADKSFDKTRSVLFSGKKAAIAFRLPETAGYAAKTLGVQDADLMGELAPWAALEIRADSAAVTGEGIFCADDSVATLSSVVAAQRVKEMTLDAFFPSDASSYTYLGISDWGTYFDDYARYLKASSQFHLYNVAVQRYNKFFGGDFRSFFLPWAGTGFAVVHSAGNDRQYIVAGVKDPAAAAKALESISDSSASRPASYRDCEIVPIGQKTIFYDLVSRTAGRTEMAFATVVDGAALFSPDLESLKNIIDDIQDGTTLVSLLPYTQHKASLATNTNLLIMLRGDLWSESLAKKATDKRRKGLPLSEIENYVRGQVKTFKNLRYNFLQVSSTGGTAFVNLRLAWDDSAPRQAAKEWSFNLETAPVITPALFPNHRTGRYDILIQDAGGTLYLLSDKGSLFWKKKLPGTITSNIVVCDLYDNKKYQMAFYTGKKFHVIDRLGNYVSDPAKIARAKKQTTPAPAAKISSTNEIAVKTGNGTVKVKTEQSPLSWAVYVPGLDAVVYRLSEGKVYGVNLSGEKLEGFPISAEKDFTAGDLGNNRRLGIVSVSAEGVVTLYRMPGNSAAR